MPENTNVVVQADPKDVEQNKVMAILAYIFFLIPLLAAKDSKFAMYHANQSLVLFIIGIAGNIIGGILFFVYIGVCVTSLVNLAWLVLAIIGIINASNGEMKPLPIVGNITILK